MNLPVAPIATEGFFVAHFLTVEDQEKSKDFYVRVLGGKVVKQENPCYIKLSNSWIILNSGGGPTPDKPEVILEAPQDLNRVNSFTPFWGEPLEWHSFFGHSFRFRNSVFASSSRIKGLGKGATSPPSPMSRGVYKHRGRKLRLSFAY